MSGRSAVCLFKRVVVLSFVLSLANSASATSQNWDGGAGSGFWTNNVNWSSDQAYPVTDETATFNGGGANRTNINVAGLSAIKYITFDGNVSTYFIGLEPINSQTLVMRNDGNYRVSMSCRSNQFFNSTIQLGPDITSASYYFQSDHAVSTLNLLGNITCPVNTGTAGDKTINVNGLGSTRFLGNLTRGYANNLDITINSPATTVLSGTNLIRYLRLNGGASSVLDIGNGLIIFTNSVLTSLGGENFSSTYGGTINGTGAMVLTTRPGEDNADNYVRDVNATLTINCRLTGGSGVGFELYTGNGIAGTFALNGANDFPGNVFLNASGTISANKFGNQYATDSGLGAGTKVRFSSWYATGAKLKYTGVGETSDRLFEVNAPAKIEQAGTGNLKLTRPFSVITSSGLTITLLGSSAGTGEISGSLANGSSSGVALTKEGTGTWTLSGTNLFTGAVTINNGTLVLTQPSRYTSATTLNGGTLALTGPAGVITNTSGITVNAGGTLLLDNTAANNHDDRVRNAAGITLNGGTVRFANTAGAANYSETLGTVALSSGASTIAASRAAVGQTSTLTLSGLTRTTGSVDFTGTGLGTDTRNRIFITGQADGLIGPWATVNGSALAAYSSTLGVYPAAAAAYTDIAARGPSSTIPDSGSSSAIRINSDGVSGPIALAAATTTIGSLQQNTAVDATIDTAAKTLRVTGLSVPSGKAGVTVGVASGDGTLSAATAGGGLALANDGATPLTVNAVIADNASASGLSKAGAGTVKLTAANTFSGGTSISAGSLVLANGDALQNSTVTLGTVAPVFDASVSGHAFTLGSLAGVKDFALSDNAGTPIALSVGKNNASTAYSGAISGGGSLVKQGTGTLSLSGANSFSGGSTLSAGGALTANSLQALGIGPVNNNGTLNLAMSPGAYSGLSVALSGAGTNNVTLVTGIPGSSTVLDGDYSGFTGVWNIGVGAAASANRVQMNGKDNAAASVFVRTNATLVCTTAIRHDAAITLQGGNTGESYGQLRLENNAMWAGSVLLAGLMTDGNDGLLGGNSGNGYVYGQITDGGMNYPLNKVGSGTLVLANTNNTFGGPLWVRQGWVRATSMRNLGQASSLGAPTLGSNNVVRLGNGTTTAGLAYAGYGDTSDRDIDLASTTANCYLDHSGTNLWRLTGIVTNSGAGSKRLQLQGSTGATGELAGVISDYSASYTNNLFKTGTGAWTLSGNNTFKGAVNVDNGILRIAHNNAFGISPKTVTVNNSANGVNPHVHLDGSAGDLTIPADITFRTSNQRAGAIFNDAGNNTILGALQLISGDGDTALNSVSGKLTIAGSVYPPTDTLRQLRLWGNGDGEISGVISNGFTAALPVYKEKGTGTWTLSGVNNYSGTTYANSGNLVIGGANGKIAAGVDIGAGGALTVTNSPDANNGDRLSNSAGVSLNGGTLRFAHPGGAANYSETAGALTVGTFESTVESARADDGQTSTLTFASLSRTGIGSVNFVGEALGDPDNRNRILFTSAPVADNAVIGPWAMYNGTNLASYTAAQGVIAVGDSVYADLSAKGPSVLPNDAAAIARINTEGTEGGISLAAEAETSIGALMQTTAWDADVGLTNGQVLKTSSLIVGVGTAALNIGTNTTSGLLMPLSAGGALTLANHSDIAALTVNTPVTSNGTASTLVKLGSGQVRLNGAVSHAGTTQLAEGELVFAANSLTQGLAGVISGNGKLIKEGGGKLTLFAANTYNGETVVRGGTLMPSNNAALGSALAGTVITNGGTLDVGYSGTDNAANFGDEVITVSGTGVNGRGAIINSSARSQYNTFRFMSLAGDTTFGGENSAARWDIRNTAVNPYLDMNGFTVTKVGSNMVGLTSVTVRNPGHINIQEGTFRTESLTTLNGSADNTMTVQNNATYEIYSLPTPIVWSLVMNDGARFGAANGNGLAQNVWAGPITLNGYARMDAYTGYTMTLAGNISGTGSLVKMGAGNTYVTGTNNTYSGGTYVSNAWLYAYNPGGLPDYATPGKVQVAAGAALMLFSGDGTAGWTVAQLNALHQSGAFVASNSVMAIDTTYTNVSGLENMNGFALYKYGSNTLTVTGINTNRAAPSGEHSNLRVYAGRLVLSSASSNVYGRCYVLPGTIGATLQIDGPTTFTESLYVGNGNSDRSTVIVNTNVTANRTWVGINQIASGTLVQNSGLFEVAPTTGSTSIFDIGRDGAYGYYRMNGGTLRAGQFAVAGGSGSILTANCGVFDLFNGTVNVTASNGWLIWGWVGGYAVGNLFGGTLTAPPANYLSMAHTANYNSFSMLNLLGPTAFVDSLGNSSSRKFYMVNSGGNLMSVINLNAGTILANQIFANSTTTPSIFNFGGGRLLANGATTLASTFMQGLTAATVYPGGAVLDVSNANITVNQALLAPTGSGVASIPVAYGGVGYIGAPVVLISGGSGTGATAIATVDLETNSVTFGQVTGLTVTSPGSGYLPGENLSVALIRGGYITMAQAGAPVLVANQATGGLTKLGTGILTLGGTNTYGGDTVISNGTLRLGHGKALPTATEVVLAGGMLDLNGNTVTNTIIGQGTVSNGTLYAVISPAGANVVGTETLALKSVNIQGKYLADVTETGASDLLTFNGNVNLSGLSLELVDTQGLVKGKTYTVAQINGTRTGSFTTSNLPDTRWHLYYSDDGSVKLVFVDGTIMFLR